MTRSCAAFEDTYALDTPRLAVRAIPDIAAYNDRFLAALRDGAQLVAIAVVPEDDSCAECRTPIFSHTDDIPALPRQFCGRRGGCGCWYAALPTRPDDSRFWRNVEALEKLRSARTG
jgi:hypothetical protein